MSNGNPEKPRTQHCRVIKRTEWEVEGNEMPNPYPIAKLKDLIDIKHGFAFASDFYTSEGPYVLLTPGNFREEGGFRWLGEKQKFYSGPAPADFVLSPGQMLIAMTEQAPGLLGSTLFVPDDGRLYLHNQRLGLVQVKDSELTRTEYLHHYLSMHAVRNQISAESAGTKVKHTSPDKLLELEIRLPSTDEQKQVAAILRTWDEAIETHDGLIARLEKQHAALVRSLVFGGSRLAHSSKSEQTKKYRWFDLPTDWRCKRIGNLAREVSERNRGDENAEILSCSKYDGFVRSLDYFKKQVFSSDLSGYKLICQGDFGFPSNHVEEGSIGLQNLTDIGLVSPIYIVFRFSEEEIDNEYAHYVLKTRLYRHIFEISTSASVDRRGSLRWDEFALIPFPVPSLKEQQKIVKVLNVSAKRIAALRKEKSLLERQKRGLMRKLLSGEWRVKC